MIFLLLTALTTTALADDAWTTAAVELQRWPAGTEGSVVTRALEPGQQVQIVLEEGTQVRVYTAGSFGWIDRALLSDEAPPPEEPAAEEGEEPAAEEGEDPADAAPADEAPDDEALPFDDR